MATRLLQLRYAYVTVVLWGFLVLPTSPASSV